MSLSAWVNSILRSNSFDSKSLNFSDEYLAAGVFSRYDRVSSTIVAALALPPDGFNTNTNFVIELVLTSEVCSKPRNYKIGGASYQLGSKPKE